MQKQFRQIFQTDVKASLSAVKAGFNLQLFEFLAPAWPKLIVDRFDGCAVHDKVELRLVIIPKVWEMVWHSLISEEQEEDSATGKRWYFVDEGLKLPFFLSYWRHTHIVQALPEGGSRIIDDVVYEIASPFPHFIWKPFISGMFQARKPKYQRYFAA